MRPFNHMVRGKRTRWPVIGRPALGIGLTEGRGGGREDGGGHVTESSRELYNRPPLGVGRQRLDVNQSPSTTHRLCIVAYSLDSILGHFIIQLGQLSHYTPEKRDLQSN
ncbi:hypothetical protein DPEC_G00014950 [Dallia pectoralis]|uniref:Uncharacterized protein n=1 Tax=Dallia pectoralis TaxID=75939 RepID=A0ACC2HNV6_DALPE|nr:hypothetical protein DPEC_G00014950 [Dallia pectoralis]